MNVKEAEAVIKGMVGKYGIKVFISENETLLTDVQLYLEDSACVPLETWRAYDEKSLEVVVKEGLNRMARWIIIERSPK